MKKSVLLLLLLVLALASGMTSAVDFPGVHENFDGPTELGVILVRFQDIPVETSPWTEFSQDDRDRIKGWLFDPAPGPSVNHLFREMSFEADSLDGEIIGTYTIESNGYEEDKYCRADYEPMWTTWRNQALAEADPTGTELVQDGLAGYDMLMFVFSKGNRCDGPYAGANGAAYRVPVPRSDGPLPYTLIFNWSTPQTMAHEVGHLKGWGHSALGGGFTGPGQIYGDYGCVMGDNYAYDSHPEFPEFDPQPDETAVALPMRHASAPWKIYSEYINQGDLFNAPDGPATETVFLAPTELRSIDFPVPPNQAPIYHAAVIKLSGSDLTYVASYRRGSLSVYDGNPVLDHLMGRVQVHSFAGSAGSNVTREDLLEAGGGSFLHDNFTVTAMTDGLNDEEFVEIEIAVKEFYRPKVSLSPSLLENNPDGFDSGLIQVTVENTGAPGSATADFVLTLGETSPEIVGGSFVPAALSLAPSETGTADLILQFAGPLADGNYEFEVIATDPVGPRAAGKSGGSYTVDSVDPVILNLQADHQGDRIFLSWGSSTNGDRYTIESAIGQDWVVIAGPGYWAQTYTDSVGIVPGSSHTYRVMATDRAGNPGPWETVTVTDPCTQGFSATIDPMDFQVNQPMPGIGLVATYDVTVTNLNPVVCDADSYTVMLSGSLSSGYGLDTIVVPDVAPGTSAQGTLDLAYFPQPWSTDPLGDVRISFNVEVIGPYGNQLTIERVRFTHDTLGPTAPSAFSGTQNNVRVELSWQASTDVTSGVASYRILRNGAYRGTTNQVSYMDFSAPSERPLTYTVLAIDEVGNLSAPANFVFTTTPGCPKCPPVHFEEP